MARSSEGFGSRDAEKPTGVDMTPTEAKRRVNKIKSIQADEEWAHREEDSLYRKALEAIAKRKVRSPAKLAQIALQTREFDFPRVCAREPVTTWTTKEGKEILLTELEDSHLINIIGLLHRVHETKVAQGVLGPQPGGAGDHDWDLCFAQFDEGGPMRSDPRYPAIFAELYRRPHLEPETILAEAKRNAAHYGMGLVGGGWKNRSKVA
jgi:hypothetical protein